MAKKANKFSNGILVANKTNGWQIKPTCGKKSQLPCNSYHRLSTFIRVHVWLLGPLEYRPFSLHLGIYDRHFSQSISLLQQNLVFGNMCKVYRFMSVYGLTWIINRFREEPIPYNDQFIMSLSGLRWVQVHINFSRKYNFRGGIAFSLTKLVPTRLLPQIHQMLSTCIAVILFTSFVQGKSVKRAKTWCYFDSIV